MAEIKGKGLPTRQTKGALGDIYVDTTTGNKYKCSGSYKVTTHAETKNDYEWKPVNPVIKNSQSSVKNDHHEADKVIDKLEERNNTQTYKKDKQRNYTKHFNNIKNAE